MTRLAILGATGRMGRALIRCSEQFDDLTVTVALDIEAAPDQGADIGTLIGKEPCGVTVASDIEQMANADVAIDFTLHAAIPLHVAKAAALGIPYVTGTTGLDAEETARVHKAAESIPVVWAPNMSPGMNMLFAMAKRASAALGHTSKIRIDETHHVHKRDAPSGTALRIAEKVAAGMDVKLADVMRHEESPVAVPVAADDEILVCSFREGEVVGDHSLTFETPFETLTLSHHAEDRDVFAVGALRSAQWVLGKAPGVYDMQDVLGVD